MICTEQDKSKQELLDFLAQDGAKKGTLDSLAIAVTEALASGIDIDSLSDDCEEGDVDAGMLLENGCTTFFMKNHIEMVALAESLAADAGISDVNEYIHSSVDSELELDGVIKVLKGDTKTMTDDLREHLYYIAEWLITRKLMMVMSNYTQHRQACT